VADAFIHALARSAPFGSCGSMFSPRLPRSMKEPWRTCRSKCRGISEASTIRRPRADPVRCARERAPTRTCATPWSRCRMTRSTARTTSARHWAR